MLIKHPLDFIYTISAKHKPTSEPRPCEKPWKIIVVEKTPTIQGLELQEVVENTITSLTPQEKTVESIIIDLRSIENGNEN